MNRYIALLRGINISGKNKLAMPELKQCFIEQGYGNVVTYLNSGNVIFDCDGEAGNIKEMIQKQFDLDIPVLVIAQERLGKILTCAPEWWGSEDKAIYDNLIFVLPEKTAEELSEMIGEPSEELEKIFIHEDVIFWSFDRKRYAKANWWKKTASAGIGEYLTIRTANTVRKLAEL